MLRRLHRDERGIAIVIAMLVSGVVFSLGLVAVQLSQHNSLQSSYDRKRVQAVHAAEAGLDAYLSMLSRTPPAAVACSVDPTDLPMAAGAQYRVTASFFSTYPGTPETAMSCPMNPNARPEAAVITSTGTATAVGSSRAVSRTMQTRVRLDPRMGGVFDLAVYSHKGLNLQNSLTVNGNGGNNGNVYTNGDFVCGNSVTIYGSVIAHGSVTQGSSCRVVEDVLAGGSVSMTQSARVGHDVVASTGSITMGNSSAIVNNARAAGPCTGCAGRVGGTITQNSPSANPYTLAFPTVNYDENAWRDAGYTIRNETSCSNALSFIRSLNGATVPYVVRITTNCTLSFSGSDDIRLGANLAIVTNGAVSITQNSLFRSTTSAERDLFFIVPRSLFSPATPPDAPATDCNGQDITVANLSEFRTLKTFFYTPCTLSISNNNTGQGQIIGGTVTLANSITFRPVAVPGNGQVIGYNPDIAYVREIANP